MSYRRARRLIPVSSIDRRTRCRAGLRRRLPWVAAVNGRGTGSRPSNSEGQASSTRCWGNASAGSAVAGAVARRTSTSPARHGASRPASPWRRKSTHHPGLALGTGAGRTRARVMADLGRSYRHRPASQTPRRLWRSPRAGSRRVGGYAIPTNEHAHGPGVAVCGQFVTVRINQLWRHPSCDQHLSTVWNTMPASR